MFKLLRNSVAQAHSGFDTAGRLLQSLPESELIRTRIEVETRQFLRRTFIVGLIKELSEQIVRIPVGDFGSLKFIAEITNQPKRQIGARPRDRQIDFQFLNPVFHVRSFVSGKGVAWPLHLGLGPKGRPVLGSAA